MPVYDEEQRKRFFGITKAEDDYGTLVGRMFTKTSENDPRGVKHTFTKTSGETATSYRRYHASIGGIITKIDILKKEGKSGNYFVWQIDMDAGDGEVFSLQVNMKSSSSNSIMHRLPSCDLTKEVKFTPYYFADKDKIITVIYQVGDDGKWKKVDKYWAYNKETGETSNGLPDLKVTEGIGGEKNYDDTEQNKFMWNYYQKNILPVLADNSNSMSSAPSPGPEAPSHHEEIEDEVSHSPQSEDDTSEEDLPF